MNISPEKRQELRTMPYKQFLVSDFWQEAREMALSRAGRRCQLCNADSNLHVHHRTYEHRGWEDENLSDLTVLCADCHERYHTSNPNHAKPPVPPDCLVYISTAMQDRLFLRSWIDFIGRKTNGVWGSIQCDPVLFTAVNKLDSDHSSSEDSNNRLIKAVMWERRIMIEQSDLLIAIPPLNDSSLLDIGASEGLGQIPVLLTYLDPVGDYNSIAFRSLNKIKSEVEFFNFLSSRSRSIIYRKQEGLKESDPWVF